MKGLTFFKRRSLVCALFAGSTLLQTTVAHAQSAVAPEPSKPELKAFAFVPATRPLKYVYSSSWLVLTPDAVLKSMTKDEITALRLSQWDAFEDAMLGANLGLETKLNAALTAELVLLGYQLKPIENLKRRIRNPDDISYGKFPFQGDILLQVYISEIGVHMPRDGAAFYPKLNIGGLVVSKNHKKPLYDNAVYFGIDADEKNKALFVGKDPNKGYKDFAALMQNLEVLKESYLRAIPLLAKQLAGDMHGAMQLTK